MRRSYKFQLRPTMEQKAALAACLEDTRQLYNAALEERREAWRMGHRVSFFSQVTRVYLAGIGHVRVHQHRAVRGRVKTITAKRENGRWYVVLSCDDVPAEPLEPTGSAAGIDLGVASFLTTSDGTHVLNPRHHAATAGRLTAAQQGLARKKRGSNRRKKAVTRVARLHGKVARQRLDHAHKTALALARDHDLIVHEDLKIKNMTKRPKPRPDGNGSHEPNGAAAKASLNKSINDAGWGIFLRVLSA